MLLFNVLYVSAHEMLDKDVLFQASISTVVKAHAGSKMEKGHIRRWSYEVGFKKFSEEPEFIVIYNYFKVHIANILAHEGRNFLIFNFVI